MTSNKTLQYTCLLILFFSFFLVLTKPAWYLLKNDYSGKSSWKADFGIPTTWRRPGDPIPPNVQLPDNSIGLDFLNVDTYMRCTGLGQNIYSTPCIGDPFGRPYTYPPMLTLLFAWIPLLSTAQAVAVWCLSILIGIALSLYLICKVSDKDSNRKLQIQSGLWIFGLTLSYPSIFSFERGNSDVFILLLFSLWIYFLKHKNWFVFGFIAALSFMVKIYPIVLLLASSCIFLSLLIYPTGKGVSEKKAPIQIGLGMSLGILLPLITMPKSHLYFFTQILPYLKSLVLTDASCANCHSWPVAFGFFGYVSIVFCLAAGLLHSSLHIQKFSHGNNQQFFYSSLLSLSYLSALMINIPNTSYDYNLILSFPFVVIWVLSPCASHRMIKVFGLIVFLIGMLSPRWVHDLLSVNWTVSPYVVFQLSGLLVCGIYLCLTINKKYPPHKGERS